MGKIEAPKRVRAEDFDKEDRNLVGKLGGIINDFQENVYQTLSNNIDFSNLAQSIVDVEVRRDSNASPGVTLQTIPQVKTNLNRKVRGVICISATNLSDLSVVPTSQPFVTFGITGTNIISIEKVSGLQPDSIYSLRLLLIT
jgi:hypothetical protein